VEPDPAELGTISLLLSTAVGDIQYRLRDAVFDVQGPTSVTLLTEDNPDATALNVELPRGHYNVTLRDGWRLERGSAGELPPLEAELLTQNPLPVLVQAQFATSATFRFSIARPEPPIDLAALFGFEDAALWSLLPGSSSTELRSSDTRVEALHSLAVSGGGYHSLRSIPLAALDLVEDTVKVAVRLPRDQPNPHWYGSLELFVDAPSVGLSDQSVGVVDLSDLPLAEFVDVQFALNSNVFNALAGEFDDLSIGLGLSVPAESGGTYHVDNLRFGGVSACDFGCESGTCVEGICELACATGEGNCDGDVANGCETPLQFDSTNCGGCGVQCGPGSLCDAGTCVSSPDCAATEADCDGDPSNLCEVDTSADADHCGGCGIVCSAGQVCAESQCLSGDLDGTLYVTSDWGSGYCGNLVLTNRGNDPTSTWKVTVDPQGATISTWSADVEQTTDGVALTPKSWNAVISPGSTRAVGFCATRTIWRTVPTIISVLP
jgi:hypothetical protein